MKTEPTYELNVEKLQSLSIADLTGLMQLMTSGEHYLPILKATIILEATSTELDKRINDIIIF
jgi:hypothetical protein